VSLSSVVTSPESAKLDVSGGAGSQQGQTAETCVPTVFVSLMWIYYCLLTLLLCLSVARYHWLRGVRNPMKMSVIGFLKTEPTSKFKNRKLSFRSSVFKKQLWRFGDGFSRCLIYNSSCSMIASTVKVFFFMPYLCTSSSESLRLTIISWTNLARKYVISGVIP